MKTLYTGILFCLAALHCCAQLNQLYGYGYTDKLSYRYSTGTGTTVTFFTDHSSNTPDYFDLKDFSGNIITTIYNFTTTAQTTPLSTSYMDGYNWTSTKSWTVPDLTTVPSGYYMLDGKIPIIIKGDNSNGPNGADIVIVCPTNTVNAYTTSDGNHGGHSLYYHPAPFVTTVSFLRPQDGAANLYCNAFLDWIRTWGPAHGYKLNFISDADLDDSPNHIGWDEIKNAKLLIIPGHSEYWTRQARLNFDRFVDAGGNALILSGNTMWCQVRYEDENSPYSADLTKLTCYRGANWCNPPNGPGCFILDPIASPSNPNYDPLLATYPWMSTDLKYSVLGSIGCDWLRGGQRYYTFTGYGGHKILIPNSPLIYGVIPNNMTVIPNPNINGDTEFDGTLVKCDANGNALDASGNLITNHATQDPVLDIAALGFYQAEMIGYEFENPDGQFNDPNTSNNQEHYCPFLVFKKTFTSGTIVNVSSSRWCTDENSGTVYGWTGTTPYRANITANIINLMISDYNGHKNGELLFTNAGTNNPGPGFIAVKPAYTTVNYSACLDGNIHFTPHGIYLDHAYKVDNGFISNPDHNYNPTPPNPLIQTRYIDNLNKFASAVVDANCSNFSALRIAHKANSENKENENIQIGGLNFSLFPNPATGKFSLQMLSSDNSEKNVYIFNSIYQEIYRKEKTPEQIIVIDLSSATKGIYFVKVVAGDKTEIKKIVLM